MACYKLKTYPACDACREVNARRHTNYNRSEAGRASSLRYQRTSKGMLSLVRARAKVRKS